MQLTGLDHADIRVASIAAVEAFYEALLPPLGLTRKSEAHVDAAGDWYDVAADRPRNVIEYHTEKRPGSKGWFVGFIESPGTIATGTRIAFALDDEANLAAVEALLHRIGARVIQRSESENYPAVFFEDPIGTRLEICVRRSP